MPEQISMNTNLNELTIQKLLDCTEFTSGLVEKLQNSFAKLDGSNATNTGVAAMLGKLQGQDKVVTTKELDAKNFATTTQLNDKVDKTSTDTFVKLDGTNAKQGAELLREMLSMKANDSDKETILEARLALVNPKAFVASDYARLDGTNITNSHEKGQAFAKAIFSVKDTTGGKTILENQLADKFVAIGSGGKAADIDPADTLPDAWANLI